MGSIWYWALFLNIHDYAEIASIDFNGYEVCANSFTTFPATKTPARTSAQLHSPFEPLDHRAQMHRPPLD